MNLEGASQKLKNKEISTADKNDKRVFKLSYRAIYF